jgi:hypothetical protein
VWVISFLVLAHPRSLRPSFTNKKWWYQEPPPKKAGQRLPEKFRHVFENKQIVCVEYDNLPTEDEREIFKVWARCL